jgi:hypothetical protein
MLLLQKLHLVRKKVQLLEKQDNLKIGRIEVLILLLNNSNTQ